MADLYQPRNVQELVDRYLRDVRLAATSEGLDEPPTQVGTDFWLTANGVANMCLLGFYNIARAEASQNVLTAEGDDLDHIREGYGLPEVPGAPATGNLVVNVTGATTITDGQVFLYPNGVSGTVVGTYVNPADGSEVAVTASESGTKTNLKAGSKVRFVSPPINVISEATVSQGKPLTGGTEDESDDRKRERILNVLRNKPAGGNWAQLRQIALDELASLSDCYVMPALGGPGSVKIVPVKDFDTDNNDYSRAASTAALAVVRAAIQNELSAGIEAVVQAAADEPADITIKVTIPESSQAGGNGQGWTDEHPWPSLEVADAGRVTVVSAATPDVLTLSANTADEPVNGLTQIAWWSSADRKFRKAMVISFSGAPGAWVVTLDRPLTDSTGASPQTGDYISPAAQNLEGYGKAWVEIFRSLGTGENTADTARLPRARRHPYVAVEDPSSITNSALATLVAKYPEITDYEFGYRSASSPTVPSLTATSPNILIPRRFGVYPL